MYTKKVFGFKDMVKWTRYETMLFFLIALAFVAIYELFDLHWFKIPWTPLALIGTAVAFVVGFQNNSAYGRIWEARKIWGGITNTSRTMGMWLQDMVTDEYNESPVGDKEIKEEIKRIIYRHIAWMTALRHAMRTHKPWEVAMNEKSNREWENMIFIPERRFSLEEEIRDYISPEDFEYVMSKNNKQTALLYLQSHHLRKLKEKGMIWEFSFLELQSLIQELTTLQGQTERIKNFPYPRHFATLNHYFIWIFLILLPMGIIPQFAEIGTQIIGNHNFFGRYFIWLSVPFIVTISWVFYTMERIGRTGENPFEGSANDVPISAMTRGIEIDLRQNLGESIEEIPAPWPVHLDTQM